MEYITTSEVARMIGVSRGTILNYMRRDDFVPSYRLSARKIVFERGSVQEWLDRRVS